MRFRIWLCMLAVLAVPLAGCQGSAKGPQRAAVSGRVTLDGDPLQEGSIGFYPTGATTGVVAGGVIQNGSYSITQDKGPVVGTNRVEIRASKKSGRQVQAPMSDPGKMTDELIEAVPAQYNQKSTLERTIEAKANTVDFELTSS